jgi:hypothetical protein
VPAAKKFAPRESRIAVRLAFWKSLGLLLFALTVAANVVQNGTGTALRALGRRQVQVLFIRPVPEPCPKHPFAIGRQEPLDLIEDCRRSRGVFDLPEEAIDPTVAVTLFRELPAKFFERKHISPVDKPSGTCPHIANIMGIEKIVMSGAPNSEVLGVY